MTYVNYIRKIDRNNAIKSLKPFFIFNFPYKNVF